MSADGKEKPVKSKKKNKKTHRFMVNNCSFEIDKTYHPLKPLGRGAYGVVCSAIDKNRSDAKVAIKKVQKAFEDLVDGKRILREVKLLRHFNHPNIVRQVDLAPGYSSSSGSKPIFDDLYIILDFMETDLHKIIYSKNELTDDHIQYFVYQILRGMKYIHSAGVLHRDLKPSNLLLNSTCALKICDFGLARGTTTTDEFELTEYVVTRWYRAPEVMCACQDYDTKIDVWSIGCIMAELHGRKPLFPGEDYIKQMNLIFGVLGTPSESDYKMITNNRALEYIKSLKKRDKVTFDKIYPKATANAVDLMEQMLKFNPKDRISVEDALKHPYLAAHHTPDNEPGCESPFGFDFEKLDITREVLCDLMMDEIKKYRPNLERQDK